MIPRYSFIVKDFTRTQIFFIENRNILLLPLLNYEETLIFEIVFVSMEGIARLWSSCIKFF